MTQFHSFLWLDNILLYIHTSASLSVPLLMDIYDFFHVQAIVNSTAVNTGVHVPFSIMVFSEYMPSNGIAWSCGSFVFSFLSNLHTILHSNYQFTLSPIGHEGSLFSTPSPAFIVYRFFFLMMAILTNMR